MKETPNAPPASDDKRFDDLHLDLEGGPAPTYTPQGLQPGPACIQREDAADANKEPDPLSMQTQPGSDQPRVEGREPSSLHVQPGLQPGPAQIQREDEADANKEPEPFSMQTQPGSDQPRVEGREPSSLHVQPGTPMSQEARRPAVSQDDCPFDVYETLELPLGKVNYRHIAPPHVAEQNLRCPLIICLHGFNGNVSTFDMLAPMLCNYGFRVLYYDLYGFGMSAEVPKRKLNLDLFIEQLEGMAEAVGAGPGGERFGLLGFSMGGIIAVEFVRRFPERVAKLLLISPAGLLKREFTPCSCCVFNCIRTRFGGCFVSLASCLMQHFVCGCLVKRSLSKRELFTLDIPEPERFPAYHEKCQKVSRQFLWNLRRSVSSYLGAIRHIPMWEDNFKSAYEEVAQGPVPVLFMWGDSDTTIPWEEEADVITDLFGPRGASCIFFPEHGHALLAENGTTVSHCASSWFSNSQDPGWIKCLADFALPNPETIGTPAE